MAKDGVPVEDDSEKDKSPDTYECADCGHQMEAMAQPGDCPECGGHMEKVGESTDN